MIYLSIDIETTGLDYNNCQVLEIGAILENTDKKLDLKDIPKLRLVLIHNFIKGEPYALNMNKNLVQYIIDFNLKKADDISEYFDNLKTKVITPNLAMEYLFNWYKLEYIALFGCEPNNKVNVVGKNFTGFDNRFLELLPNNSGYSFHRRVLDPAILYLEKDYDEVLPDLQTCLDRAEIEKSVAHTAVEDAWDVIQLLRNKGL